MATESNTGQGHPGQGHAGLEQEHIGREPARQEQKHEGQEQEHVGLEQEHVGQTQEHTGQEHAGQEQEHAVQGHAGQEQEHTGQEQEHAGQEHEGQEHAGQEQEHAVQQQVHAGHQQMHTGHQEPDESYENEATRLRLFLKLYFYAAFKWKHNACSFHLIYCFVFFIQVIKVSLITDQMFRFGYDRGNFSSVVNRGHLTLRHLLLHGWSASWETLPYPPAHGDFAVYTIDDLEKGINFAVSRYYNAEEVAVGYYVRMKDDKMTATIKYFTFPGFGDTKSDGINIFDITFPVDAGLTRTVIDNRTLYSYNVTKEFEHLNLSQPMKIMLSTTLQFTLHSVRSHKNSKLATCLQIKGEVIYTDLDNNGQVTVDLETYTTRIKCSAMNLSVEDWELESTLKVVGSTVMVFCVISLLITILTIAFALYVYRVGLISICSFVRYILESVFKFWDITVIISDILTLVGTAFVTSETEDQEWMIGTLDSHAFWLGIGCVFARTSLLRFLKFNIKFHLLFSTLYRAFLDVMAYLICVIVLFIGFWVCGYVVMGPYHVKVVFTYLAFVSLMTFWKGKSQKYMYDVL